MIARRLRKRIDPDCKDISIQVSYGTADVRDTLKKMYDLFSTPCGETFAVSQPIYEPELLQFFERTIFKEYETATAKELSRWAVTQAIKRNFIITGTVKNAFYLSPQLKKRPGRPKKDGDKKGI